MRLVLPTLHVRRSAQAIPLAAASLVANLPEALRAEARLLDLFPDQALEDMRDQILALEPELVAFPLYLWNRRACLELARALRRARPELVLLVGGPEATGDPQGVLKEGALDLLIRGEGELSFRALLETLQAGGDPAGVAGLSLRRDGELLHAPDRAPLAELDGLASPWLTGVLTPREGGGLLWEVARGCPWSCTFCFDARGSHGVRAFGPERLTRELQLFAAAGVSHLWVLDSSFNYPPERGRTLLQLLERHAPGIHVHLEAKAEFLDADTIRRLGRLPCSVQLGLQSARPEIVRHLHRSLDLSRFTSKLHQLNAEGVTFGLDLIYGLPQDDHAGFCQSLDTALALTPNQVDIFPLSVLPGTALHRQRQTWGLQSETAPPYQILASASYPAEQLERSRLLAAATDLFYNTGRAVGFFGSLLATVEMTPAAFLQGFADWALEAGQVARAAFLASDDWSAEAVLPLQEGYTAQLLRSRGQAELWPLACDVLRFHFHYAETLLGPETLPAAAGDWPDCWRRPWAVAETLRLVRFQYEVLELFEMGALDLREFAALFRPVGSLALLLRREGEVVCESLQEDFARLLTECDGRRTPEQIFAGSIARREGEELVQFALAEGLLVPVAALADGAQRPAS